MKRNAWGVAMSIGVAVVVVAVGVDLATAKRTPNAPTTLSGTFSSASSKLQISDVTVTAASIHGESAVVMALNNETRGPISLMTVTSPLSSMGMLYYDTNMCQGNTAMSWLPNILISSKQVQLLGYRNQGVMLSLLHESLKVGESVPLKIKYSNFSSSRTITVEAHVVAPPKGLHFRMGVMKM